MSYNSHIINKVFSPMDNLRIKQLFLFFFFCLSIFIAKGEDGESTYVELKIMDKVTNRILIACDVKLYTADTVYITDFYRTSGKAMQCIVKSPKPGNKYLIKIDNMEAGPHWGSFNEEIEAQGPYEPQWVGFTIPDDNKKSLTLAPVKLSRPQQQAPIELKELEVKASRVMFYHKGDTLIYNADAFVLADGSMLDALITQLPGVELKSDGRIYCNGKFVDNLLINGRDLFNGNKKLALENLAAYTVKNIAVYDKQSKNSKLIGLDLGDAKYVMDVRLKRQYANGWIINAEGGYGTSDRYMGRVFGMWFSDNASISAFGGTNNLSDRSEPGRDDGSWSPDRMETGVTERYLGGVLYTVKGPEGKWEVTGDVKYNRSILTTETERTSRNFFDSGDTFDYSWDKSRQRDWRVSTNHKIELTVADKINLNLTPDFSYFEHDVKQGMTAAMFATEIKDVSEQMIKNIYAPGDTLAGHMINRNLKEYLSYGKGMKGNLEMSAFIPIVKVGANRSMLDLKGGINFVRREEDRFNRYDINYGSTADKREFASQYFKGDPDRDYNGFISATFKRYINSPTRHFDISYKYAYGSERRTSLLYLLDDIAGFDSSTSPIGQLPSMREYAPYADPNQSYETKFYQHVNEITPNFNDITMVGESSRIAFGLNAPVRIYSRRFDYILPVLDKTEVLDRTDVNVAFKGFFTLMYNPKDKWQSTTSINVDLTPRPASLFDMVRRENTTDPLNIYVGNPDLRNAYDFHVNLIFLPRKVGCRSEHQAYADYRVIFNQFARGYSYNQQTGVRTYSTYNVNGNWDLQGTYRYTLRFGRNRMFNIQSSTNPGIINSVDYAGISDNASGRPPRRNVATLSIGESLKFNWQSGSHKLSAHINGRANRYTSSDGGFNNFTSWTSNYGLSGISNLPYGLGISTDITLYTRGGFDDNRLNTSDLVWNARLTKSLFNGSMVLALDAYDLLHQLNNINYMVNAQARTETVSNVIPAYLLFHVQWRFNKQPKKWNTSDK